ncbi:hypothetical protein [Cellulomonas sp. NPDC089187]|uniref:hypothetical protein n=1 Tax=Cellulomonas sp. NPDC089187 TaxID=3154970 RepID=UPI00342752AE
MTEQWARVDDAARAVRVRPGTIRVWATRGKVRTDVFAGRRVVHLGDVRRAEKNWRDRITAP